MANRADENKNLIQLRTVSKSIDTENLRPEVRHPIVKRFMENKLAVGGLIVVALFYFIAIIAPVIQRYPDSQIQAGARDLHPSAQHWLGTDRNGRDEYSRLLNGGRVSLAVGFVAVAIIMTIGTTLGAISGYFGGWVDSLIMRFTDILLSIPQILLLISAAALFLTLASLRRSS